MTAGSPRSNHHIHRPKQAIACCLWVVIEVPPTLDKLKCESEQCWLLQEVGVKNSSSYLSSWPWEMYTLPFKHMASTLCMNTEPLIQRPEFDGGRTFSSSGAFLCFLPGSAVFIKTWASSTELLPVLTGQAPHAWSFPLSTGSSSDS